MASTADRRPAARRGSPSDETASAASVDPNCAQLGCTHPPTGTDEWTLMWMRGLETDEIARLCAGTRRCPG